MASLRLLVLTAALYACGGAGGTSVTVEQAWARTSAAGQTTGAVYFELTVPNDDLLIGVAVSPSVASDAQIHSSMTIGDGSTMMHEASSLPMVADEPVLFEPGGYHVMLVDLVEPLVAGDVVALELDFESAGQTAAAALVSDEAP